MVRRGDERFLLIDFGLAKDVSKPTFSMCGSPAFLAPEVTRAKAPSKGYGVRVDWWALGILVCQTCNRQSSFKAGNPAALQLSIIAGPKKEDLPPDVWGQWPNCLLHTDPAKRWPA